MFLKGQIFDGIYRPFVYVKGVKSHQESFPVIGLITSVSVGKKSTQITVYNNLFADTSGNASITLHIPNN